LKALPPFPPVLIFTLNRSNIMATPTPTSTSPKSTHFGNYSISVFSLFISLVLLFFTNGIMAQADIVPNYAKADIKDSIELRLDGLEEVQDLDKDASSWYEYFWIHGDGNFTTNTRDTFIHARYLHQDIPGSNFDNFYNAKAYSTSVYRSRDRVPTKMEEDVFTNPSNNVTNPDSIITTEAVQSGYLHLQFNHSELVPNDTTIWVLSIKNPLKNSSINTFQGEVYLFFNSPIKVHKSSVEVTGGSNDDPDNPVSPKVKTQGVKERAIEEEPVPRFAEFVFQEDFIYNEDFANSEEDIETNIAAFAKVGDAYKSGLVWHFDNLRGEEERHLFIEFKDDENIFASEGDPSTKVVEFLAAITATPIADDQDAFIPDSLDAEDLAIIDDLDLDVFVNALPDTFGFEIVIDDVNVITNLSRKIVDLYKIQPLAKRAHDPNQLTIQACSCPPESDGAQKLILTAEFENDGDANAFEAIIRIPLDSLIDPSSIAEDPLGFFGPELTAGNISMSFSEDQDTIIWTLLDMNVFSTKHKGSGHPSTYGQVIFTALTKPDTKLEDISKMKACIQFRDAVGLTGTVCTPEVLPTYLSLDQSKNSGTQGELQCEECVFPGCLFPLWLIFLIILVIGFAIWIAFDNS
jgi:hypothetical protein